MTPRPAPDNEARRLQVVGDARRIAEAEGWTAVTVRRLADALGLSQPMLYALFPNRDAIVSAAAVDGVADLTNDLRKAVPDVRAVTEAYLRWARRNPASYDAMFTMPTTLRFARSSTPAPLREAFDVLRETFGPDETRTEIGWATLHGIAVLQQTGRMRPRARSARVDGVVDLFDASSESGRASQAKGR